jgi:hypothetical protein
MFNLILSHVLRMRGGWNWVRIVSIYCLNGQDLMKSDSVLYLLLSLRTEEVP